MPTFLVCAFFFFFQFQFKGLTFAWRAPPHPKVLAGYFCQRKFPFPPIKNLKPLKLAVSVLSLYEKGNFPAVYALE